MDTPNMEHGPQHEDRIMGKGKTCGCPHHKVLPVLAIVLGFEFLLAEINVLTWSFVNVTWPIVIIIAGVMALFKGKCACCSAKEM